VAPDNLLRLRAEDAEDLAVISAVAQDALVSVKDLTYDRAARRFTLVLNRFRWEAKPVSTNGEPAYERTVCAVTFDTVDGATYRGFSRRDHDRILSLLAIRSDDKNGAVDLEFAGGATLRLAVAAIKAYATDLGEAWPTAWQPGHNADEAP
jgi:Protein of unknown function (DUF2948)